MTINQKIGPDDASPISRKLLEVEEVVFAEWEKRVRDAVRGADRVAHPILIDTLPTLYHNLVEALTPRFPRTSAATPSVAAEHGGERARITAYRVEDVIAEYQILRATIIDTLRANGFFPSDEELRVIISSVEASIREAAMAFTLTHSGFREQFIATLAHDIRNPLAVAQNSAQMVLLSKDIHATAAPARKILESLNRIDQIVREMLDTVIFEQGARLSLHPEQFDIASLVNEVRQESADSTRIQVSGPPILGWWDRRYMKRVLENLIANAAKYGAPDGRIRITFLEYHGRMELSVHNLGDPIPPEEIEFIFQVFRRAKAAKEGDKSGWGIGLPFVRSVTECHGGSVDVDSSAERGTTFLVDVPLDSRPFQDAPTLAG